MGLDKKAVGNMQWKEYEPKPFNDVDIDIKVSHSGICASDLHTLRSGWFPTPYPCVVGHEIVGTAVRVGSKVEGIKVGERVGVGAQSDSCLQADCYECTHGHEPYCQKPAKTNTFADQYKDGSKAYGGHAKYWRGPSHFVLKIPDSIPSAQAAPMLCGGVTTYSPLKRNGAGPNKRVGIIGIGMFYMLIWTLHQSLLLTCARRVGSLRPSLGQGLGLPRDYGHLANIREEKGRDEDGRDALHRDRRG